MAEQRTGQDPGDTLTRSAEVIGGALGKRARTVADTAGNRRGVSRVQRAPRHRRRGRARSPASPSRRSLAAAARTVRRRCDAR